jgi:hypothetical protein
MPAGYLGSDKNKGEIDFNLLISLSNTHQSLFSQSQWWLTLSAVPIAMLYIIYRGASRSLPQFIAVRVEPSPNQKIAYR